MTPEPSQLPSDGQLLYEYLGRQLQAGECDRPAADVLADLSQYSTQLQRLRAMVSEAEASLSAGEGTELDVAALLQRVHQRSSDERSDSH